MDYNHGVNFLGAEFFRLHCWVTTLAKAPEVTVQLWELSALLANLLKMCL